MCTTGKPRNMEYASLDPYEQQLLKVFDSYDFENQGSLDKDGLTQLCCTLQLEEQGIELVQHLLSDQKNSRVTFSQFKEALLTLLGNVQNNRSQTDNQVSNKDTDKGSPDREVSPKFVYGSKKYGRRSRPRNEDSVVLEELNENMNYSNKISYNTSVQRSNSQSDVLYSKKRKTTTKLKRCTSFPGSHDYDIQKPNTGDVFVTNGLNSEQEVICTEEMLRKAWEKLGVGEDGYLNQTELILVCDAIGLHRLAKGVIRQLSNKLELDVDRKISFQELLEALQQDDAWSEVFNPNSPTNTVEEALNLPVNCVSSESIFDAKSIQHINLGPDGTGYVNPDLVAEMWENAGISSPKTLLRELGFVSTQINVSELAAALEKELKSLNESKTEHSSPYVVLLQAVLVLYRSEIRCLRGILEQMHAEREKLKGDVLEANNRATMLAQEVDDNHARMEQSTQNQVKLLEQRHSDILKEVTQRFCGEKEQIVHLNQSLEQKIQCLEAEEAKLRNDLLMAQEYSSTVEKENHLLSGQVSELRQVKDMLTEQVNILENEKQNYEFEHQQAQIEPLLKKLSELQIENSQLRDKNDEMLSEIENLNSQMCMMRTKSSSTPTFHNLEQSIIEENVSFVCEGVGLGSKRRNDDSPSKDLNILGLGDGSPRLGKVRKYHSKTKTENLELPVTSSESGFDTELEPIDSSLSISINETEEIGRLQSKIAHLEEILKQHSIPVPSANFFISSNPSSLDEPISSETKLQYLMKRCSDLQNLVITVQSDLSKMLSQKEICGCEGTHLKNLNQKLIAFVFENETHTMPEHFDPVKNKNYCDASTETDNFNMSLEEQIEKFAQENKDLVTKCSELENCIELLKTEYERCEDYWSSKLDDERQMFEQEQIQSSEKLTELIAKMAEYEAQFANQDEPDYRLPPIEEKYNLEKQFTDLEQEYEDYKEHAEFQIAEKTHEVADLKEQLCKYESKQTSEIGVQVECDPQASLEYKMSTLSNCVVESTNLFSSDTMPFGWSTSKTVPEQNSPLIQRDYVNPTFTLNKTNSDKPASSNSPQSSESSTTQEMSSNSIPWQNSSTPQPFSIISLPSTSAESTSTVTDNNNTTPSRPKRSRRHDKNYHKMQRLNSRKSDSEKESNSQNSNRSSPFKWKAVDNPRVNNGEQIITVPVGALHNLNGRLHHLEQRCRHLQVALKQQHYHAEQMLQHSWQQHRGEKAELQYLLKSNQEKLENQMRICNEQLERLTRTDMLVKDMYVENSYLVANVQRLEKQCHILSQYHSASSSV